MTESLVELDQVSKTIANRVILNSSSFTIAKGDSIALTGHNGAGKSTLLRLIGGLTRASSGSVNYAADLKINYVPEHFPKMNITAQQYICHMGAIEGLSAAATAEKSQLLWQRFFMDNMRSVPMKNLSKGSLQKVAVIQALLSQPALLLLDEPLSGQDIASQEVFIDAVNQLIQSGTAVVMAGHEDFLIRRIAYKVIEITDGNLKMLSLEQFSQETDKIKLGNKGNEQ